jgi:hypothetical protein
MSSLSHVVVFWGKPGIPDAGARIVAGAEKYLRPIPQALFFHAGLPVPSSREVVQRNYAAALNLRFASAEDEAAYQVHPLHLEFLAQCSPLWERVAVYDFR